MSIKFSNFWQAFWGEDGYILDCGDIDDIFAAIFPSYFAWGNSMLRENKIRIAKGRAKLSKDLCQLCTKEKEYQAMLDGFGEMLEYIVSLRSVQDRCRRVCRWALKQSDPILQELASQIDCRQVSRPEVAEYLTKMLNRILVIQLVSTRRSSRRHPKSAHVETMSSMKQ